MDPSHQIRAAIPRQLMAELQTAIVRSDPLSWTLRVDPEVRLKVTRKPDANAQEESFSRRTYLIPYGFKGPISVDHLTSVGSRANNVAALNTEFFAELFGRTDMGSLLNRIEIAKNSIYTVEFGRNIYQGSGAQHLHSVAEKQLELPNSIAKQYLEELVDSRDKVPLLSWKKGMSQDEKEITYRSSVEGFDIEVGCLTQSELLGQRIVRHTVSISYQKTLIGPHCITGEKALAIFKMIEGHEKSLKKPRE